MIKTFKIICFFLFLIGCKSEKPEELNYSIINIKGTIHSDYKKSFTLFTRNILTDDSETHLIDIDKTGRFEYNLSIDYPQVIFLQLQTNRNTPVFVYPGDSISVEYSDTLIITYSNRNSQEFDHNLNLVENMLAEIATPVLNPIEYQKISEIELKRRIDSVTEELNQGLKLISAKNNLSNYFISIAQNEIDYAITSSIADYDIFNNSVFKIKRDIPDSYYYLSDSLVSHYNELILTSNAFRFFNAMQFRYSIDNINNILKLKSSLIHDIFLLKAINQAITNKDFNKAKELIDLEFPSISNQALKDETMHRYLVSYNIYKNPSYSTAKLKSLASKDSTGILKEITSTYPGKVLYLKFWAPWCGPCMAQLPYVKQIEKEFNPDDFLVVNLCVSYPKDKWKAVIKEYNISGIHYLLSDNQYNEFRTLLNIQGIPRYVLINKQGDIIDKDAPIPGDDILQGLNYSLVDKVKKLIENK